MTYIRIAFAMAMFASVVSAVDSPHLKMGYKSYGQPEVRSWGEGAKANGWKI